MLFAYFLGFDIPTSFTFIENIYYLVIIGMINIQPISVATMPLTHSLGSLAILKALLVIKTLDIKRNVYLDLSVL